MNKKVQLKMRWQIKLMLLFLFLFPIAVATAQVGSSQAQKQLITLDERGKTLDEILLTLSKSVKMWYGFHNSVTVDTERNYSLTIHNATIEEALNALLKESRYSYRIDGDKIVIINKPMVQEKQQEKIVSITRKVVDAATRKPITGATVIIMKTGMGAITDADGMFTLKGKEGDEYEISFTGMEPYNAKIITNSTVRIIEMKASILNVRDVVVTGYQQIDRRLLTSAVNSLRAEDLLEGSSTSIDKMLQGKLPGVAVLNQSATPGAAPKIRIRGSSSITGNREPVWVVDGIILEETVPISTEELNSLDNVNLIGNAISTINPEDIERIDILKDASATAIYGVKAANGVIVVTTKKGSRGTPRVSYSTSLNVMSPPTYESMMRMNSEERIEMSQEMHRRGLEFGANNPADIGYEGALLNLWNKEITYNQFLTEVENLKNRNTDWYGELFNPSFSHQHTISVSGGSDKISYYFSGGYSNENSVTIGEQVTKYSGMSKINIKFNEKVNLALKINGGYSQTERPHSSVDPYAYAYETSRAIAPESFYSKSTGYSGYLPYNINNELKYSGNDTDNSNVGMNINFDWKIAKWVKFNSLIGLALNNNNQSYWAGEESYYISEFRQTPYGSKLPDLSLPENANFANQYCMLPFGGEYKSIGTRNTSYTIRNSVALMHTMGKHEISGNIGTEVRSSKYDGLTSTQYGYLRERGQKFVKIPTATWPKYAKMVEGLPDVINDTKNNVLSYYATAAYVYDSRYILNFNIRADGSNKFGQDKSVRFLPVWSVSGRWNIMNEKFMQRVNGNIVNNLSIRGSYGIQGNVHPDQVPNLIVNIGELDPISQEYSSALHKMANTKLRWEKTYSSNVAVDVAFLRNRIFGSFDYYYKKGVDQVVQKNVAPSMGESRVAINAGDVENKGWDLSITFVPIESRNWIWSLSLNTGKNYNKVLNVGNPTVTWRDYLTGSLISNGKAISSFYSYQFGGLNENGYPTYLNANEKDEEGNMLVQSQLEAFERAMLFSGQREPDLAGGFSTYLKFKNFTFNCLMSFNIGNKIRLNNLYSSSGQTLPHPSQNMSSEFVNRWQQAGDEDHTNIPILSQEAGLWGDKNTKYPIADNIWDMYNNSDLRVVSGSFLRCRSMSLRYELPKGFTKKIYLKGASVTFDVGNLFVIKDSKLEGRDPEQIALGSRSLPPQQTYTLSINLSF